MEDKFICKNLMLTSYFITKGNPNPELDEKDGRIVFLFDKTDKLIEDFHDYKQGNNFANALISNFYEIKKKMFELKDSRSMKS